MAGDEVKANAPVLECNDEFRTYYVYKTPKKGEDQSSKKGED